MILKKNNSFYSNLDNFSRNGDTLNKRKTYYETSIKKKKEKLFSFIYESDSLINALKKFSVKCELDVKQKLKDSKFVVSFDDLISLIKYCLESQKQLNYFLQDELENIKNFTSRFINNIYNYIYSFEKVETITPISKTRNKIKFSLNKENTNINTTRASYTTRTNYNNSTLIDKSSKCLVEKEKTKINQKNKNIKLNINNQINLKNNNKTINKSITFINLGINSNKKNNYTKSYFMRKNYKNISTIVSLEMSSKTKNNNIKSKKIKANKSSEKKVDKPISKTFFLKENENENSTEINRVNESVEKRENNQNDLMKTISYPMSIVTVCDLFKSSSFIKKNKYKEENNLNKKRKLNSNKSMNDIKKDDIKIIYNNGVMLGMRKKILNRIVPRPSNYANKLLETGIKYITDFNGLKEEESKKKHYY